VGPLLQHFLPAQCGHYRTRNFHGVVTYAPLPATPTSFAEAGIHLVMYVDHCLWPRILLISWFSLVFELNLTSTLSLRIGSAFFFFSWMLSRCSLWELVLNLFFSLWSHVNALIESMFVKKNSQNSSLTSMLSSRACLYISFARLIHETPCAAQCHMAPKTWLGARWCWPALRLLSRQVARDCPGLVTQPRLCRYRAVICRSDWGCP
jgi:hypothetical protein